MIACYTCDDTLGVGMTCVIVDSSTIILEELFFELTHRISLARPHIEYAVDDTFATKYTHRSFSVSFFVIATSVVSFGIATGNDTRRCSYVVLVVGILRIGIGKQIARAFGDDVGHFGRVVHRTDNTAYEQSVHTCTNCAKCFFLIITFLVCSNAATIHINSAIGNLSTFLEVGIFQKHTGKSTHQVEVTYGVKITTFVFECKYNVGIKSQRAILDDTCGKTKYCAVRSTIGIFVVSIIHSIFNVGICYSVIVTITKTYIVVPHEFGIADSAKVGHSKPTCGEKPFLARWTIFQKAPIVAVLITLFVLEHITTRCKIVLITFPKTIGACESDRLAVAVEHDILLDNSHGGCLLARVDSDIVG